MRCRGCNCEIKVMWRQPDGAAAPLLEDLCLVCQAWAEVAKQPGEPVKPTGRRIPVLRENLYEVEGTSQD